MLGGFTAGHYVFDLVWAQLRGRNRLITWEPRGLGGSDCPDPGRADYGVDAWARDLLARRPSRGRAHEHLGAGVRDVLRRALRPPLARTDRRVDRLYRRVGRRPGKGYAAIWEVYRTIAEQFGTTGFGARMLANLFDVPSPAWFYAWEQRNIEAVLHPETLAATVGHCLTQADVREDLAGVDAPILVLQGDQGWQGERRAADEDASLALMRERLRRLEVDGARRAPRLCAASAAARVRRPPCPDVPRSPRRGGGMTRALRIKQIVPFPLSADDLALRAEQAPRDVLGAGTVVDTTPVRNSFRTDGPNVGTSYYEWALLETYVVEAGLSAEDEGYDAVVVDTTTDWECGCCARA